MSTYRLQRLTINQVNEFTDPPGRAFIELESTDGGPPIQLSYPYAIPAIPDPGSICEFIKNSMEEGNSYDDDECTV